MGVVEIFENLEICVPENHTTLNVSYFVVFWNVTQANLQGLSKRKSVIVNIDINIIVSHVVFSS